MDMNHAYNYDEKEFRRYRIIISINPITRDSDKAKDYPYYGEISKVSQDGTLYNTVCYMWYKTPEDAFKDLMRYAEENGIKVD